MTFCENTKNKRRENKQKVVVRKAMTNNGLGHHSLDLGCHRCRCDALLLLAHTHNPSVCHTKHKNTKSVVP